MAAWTADAVEELGADYALPAACRGSGSPAALEWLADRMRLAPGMRLLDSGAGVGGPARLVQETHSDLWVLRVKPDAGDTSYLPGQYASLGLGYWEERIDDADDPEAEERWDKLIRRSYSISSRMFDDHGYLTDDNALDELEFYIVLVEPTPDNVPGLTPRLALKKVGDRIYLGPKVAGRYTLRAVTAGRFTHPAAAN